MCEDDGTLQRELRPSKEEKMPGFLSMPTGTFVGGVVPQERQLVLAVPLRPTTWKEERMYKLARGKQL